MPLQSWPREQSESGRICRSGCNTTRLATCRDDPFQGWGLSSLAPLVIQSSRPNPIPNLLGHPISQGGQSRGECATTGGFPAPFARAGLPRAAVGMTLSPAEIASECSQQCSNFWDSWTRLHRATCTKITRSVASAPCRGVASSSTLPQPPTISCWNPGGSEQLQTNDRRILPAIHALRPQQQSGPSSLVLVDSFSQPLAALAPTAACVRRLAPRRRAAASACSP